MRAEDNIIPILCISEQCRDESSPVFSIMLCSKVLGEERCTRGVSEKKRWEQMNEAEQFSVKAHENTIYLSWGLDLSARNNINSISPVERSALLYWFLSGKLLRSGALGVTHGPQRRPLGLFTGWPRSRTTPVLLWCVRPGLMKS